MAPIQAAGGVVMRGGSRRPLFAVVRRRKDDRWVLPRGKLKRDERPIAGAKREVFEETGHRVRVHEFLGAITYNTRGKAKVVQYWRMQADEHPVREPMEDIKRVDWLSLSAAIKKLNHPMERLFLRNVGRRVLKMRDGYNRPGESAVRSLLALRGKKKRAKSGGRRSRNILKRMFGIGAAKPRKRRRG